MPEKMFCPKCNMWIEGPSANTPGREWIKFQAGRCPKCETPLLDSPPLAEKNSESLPHSKSVTPAKPFKSRGFFPKLFHKGRNEEQLWGPAFSGKQTSDPKEATNIALKFVQKAKSVPVEAVYGPFNEVAYYWGAKRCYRGSGEGIRDLV